MNYKMKIAGLMLGWLFLFQAMIYAQDVKKEGQTGMTYLAISLGARGNAMGDATVASVRGIQGIFYNQAVLADIKGFAMVANQVDYLVDTKVYGIGVVYGLGRLGTVGIDLVSMDYGHIEGTRRVDRSIDSRGYVLTGNIGVAEYAVGLSYAYRFSDRVALGGKIKLAHENLGSAEYVSHSEVDTETGGYNNIYKTKNWSLTHAGFDFGGIYYSGFKSLAFAFAFQNFSTDMKYYFEEFQMPFIVRMGFSMDIADLFMENHEHWNLNVAVDVLHPNDNYERVYTGAELVLLNKFALRCGYKSNHDIESFSFGFGLNIEYAGFKGRFDYGYSKMKWFEDVNRISFNFDL
ncbi:PorV/PorQ family protein [bacterium]|nr:PorV/PorQ family protein [bacterium]